MYKILIIKTKLKGQMTAEQRRDRAGTSQSSGIKGEVCEER